MRQRGVRHVGHTHQQTHIRTHTHALATLASSSSPVSFSLLLFSDCCRQDVLVGLFLPSLFCPCKAACGLSLSVLPFACTAFSAAISTSLSFLLVRSLTIRNKNIRRTAFPADHLHATHDAATLKIPIQRTPSVAEPATDRDDPTQSEIARHSEYPVAANCTRLKTVCFCDNNAAGDLHRELDWLYSWTRRRDPRHSLIRRAPKFILHTLALRLIGVLLGT